MKSFRSQTGPFVSLALSQTRCKTITGIPVYSPAFSGAHCAYLRRDGQAKLTCVSGYVLRRFNRSHTITHTSTNRARRKATTLIELREQRIATKTSRHQDYVRQLILCYTG